METVIVYDMWAGKDDPALRRRIEVRGRAHIPETYVGTCVEYLTPYRGNRAYVYLDLAGLRELRAALDTRIAEVERYEEETR